MTPLRSALFLPASNARAIAKARTLDVDAVILDLEDAVAPEGKVAARAQAAEAVRDDGFGNRRVVIRINGVGTPWFADDAVMMRALGIPVLLPKADDVATVDTARRAVGTSPLWLMIETARGVLNLPAISASAERYDLEVLVAGSNDLANDLRCRLDAYRTALLPALTGIVTAARGANLVALDGVTNAIDDQTRLAAECEHGRTLGFDGKTLIHPSQIDAANRIFGPTDEEIAQAEEVVRAFADPANAGRGAIRLGGGMVERLHLADAERMLAFAAQVRER